MDTVSESDGREECFSNKEELNANFHDENENAPKNPLLHLFVQFAWDPTHGQYWDAAKYRRIENWLEFVYDWRRPTRIPRLHEEDYMSDWPENFDETVTQDIPDREDRIILGNLARTVRMIRWLVRSKGNVNYINCGRSVLHEFLYHRIKIRDQSKIQDLIKGLVAMKVPLYTMDSDGNTPFDLAAACPRDSYILQTMVESLVDVEECTKNGDTALHILVNNCLAGGQHKDGYVELVRTLLAKGANVNSKNNRGLTPVHLAAEKFQTDVLRLFAEQGANFNEKTNDDKTPLHMACKSMVNFKDSSKIIETFDFLVSQGCDVEAVAKDHYKPSHFAAESNRVEIVDRLIALGASVNCRTQKTLLTPLYLAAKSDKLDNMKALVKAGADVNAEAADGSTPIFMSAMLGSYESLQFLMDQEADLHRRDSLMGFTLLHMAANDVNLRLKEKYDTKVGERQKITFKKFEALIDKGLDVNDSGLYGVTPLQLAALAPNVDAVKLLLARGAEMDLQVSQWTALHLASIIKSVDVVKFLVANGADVNRQSGTGRWTPLQLSVLLSRTFAVGIYADGVEKNDVRFSCPIRQLWSYTKPYNYDHCLDVMTILIDKGADVNAENGFGETPLHLVSTRPSLHREMEKLLQTGVRVNVQDRKGRLPVHDVCECDGSLKLLLDYGADINDDDTSKLIMSSWKGVKNVAIQHAIKLKLVGLPIAKVYEPLIDDPDFADFHEQCSKEAIQLRNHRDTDGFSLYGFLKMDPKFQYHFVDKISRDFKNLEELFPLYAGLIRGACCESVIRRQLLESARIVWAENSGVHLPDVCVEHILSYLNNRCLKLLTTSVEEVVKYAEKREYDCLYIRI